MKNKEKRKDKKDVQTRESYGIGPSKRERRSGSTPISPNSTEFRVPILNSFAKVDGSCKSLSSRENVTIEPERQILKRSATERAIITKDSFLTYWPRFRTEYKDIGKIKETKIGRVYTAQKKDEDKIYNVEEYILPVTAEFCIQILRKTRNYLLLKHHNLLPAYQAWIERMEDSNSEDLQTNKSASANNNNNNNNSNSSNNNSSNSKSKKHDMKNKEKNNASNNSSNNNGSDSSSSSSNHNIPGGSSRSSKNSSNDNNNANKNLAGSNSSISNTPLNRKGSIQDDDEESVDSSITAITFTEYNLTTDDSTHGTNDDPTDDNSSDSEFSLNDSFSHVDDEGGKATNGNEQTYLLYLQTDHIDRTLFDYINNRKETNQSYSLSVFQQIVMGVEYLHSQNIIHGSLNPGNIYLKQVDGGDRVYIGGHTFGIDEIFFNYNSDESDEILQAYVSPEQLRGSEHLAASDIYQLGIILFELFYEYKDKRSHKKSLKDLRKRILPTSILLNYPNISAIILWLISPAPKDRPSCSDILKSTLFSSLKKNVVVIPKQELDERDKRLQIQESKIHQQENIIKEQEKQIAELFMKVGRDNSPKS